MGKHRASGQRPARHTARAVTAGRSADTEWVAPLDVGVEAEAQEIFLAPALPTGGRRIENSRLAGVAGVVVAVTVGLANVLPGGGAGVTAVMAPVGADVLHGIEPGEPLPTVPVGPGSPEAPRQVIGPDPIAPVAPMPSAAPAAVVIPAGAYRGIPGPALAAYRAAAATMAIQKPGCHLPWALLAGIGRIESGHAAGGAVDATGRALKPIIGPRLDGSNGFALVRDTDRGRWDGDTVYDRAVGPMQFLPGTWRAYGRDGNGDGVADPENIFDAALTAAAYLCDGGGDLSTRTGLLGAVFRYNQSWQYVSLVLTWAGVYAGALPAAGPAPTAPPSPEPTRRPTPTPTPSRSSLPTPTVTPTSPPGPTPTPKGTQPPATPTGTPPPGATPKVSGTPIPAVAPSTAPAAR